LRKRPFYISIVRLDQVIELFGPPLNFDPVTDTAVPQLRNQGCRDEFALVHRTPLKKDNCRQPAEKDKGHDIGPEIKIVDRMRFNRMPGGIYRGAVILVVRIDLAENIRKEALSIWGRLPGLCAGFVCSLGDNAPGRRAKYNSKNQGSN
jgi:hypothetical protein